MPRHGHARSRRDTDAALRPEREIWTGDLSSVIGLQKRGLRGLMEGRRLRERSSKPGSTGGPMSLPVDGTSSSMGHHGSNGGLTPGGVVVL